MSIAKIGDEIHWNSYGIRYEDYTNGDREYKLIGYKSKVVTVDLLNKEYGVDMFYRFDKIPFDKVTKIISDKS